MRDLFGKFGDLFLSSPISAVAVLAGGFALASTPLAFAILGRMPWFAARRGRTLQRPDWWSMVVGMMLTMAVPAIFLALLVKSQFFDPNRYEFDPNRTWSVVDQGRQYETHNALESAYKLDEAVKKEQKRLGQVRADLVNGVKKLDTAMLALRETAARNPAVIPPVNDVLDQMAGVRKAVGLDAPQQLMNLKAEPAALAGASTTPAPPSPFVPNAPVPAPPSSSGLAKPEADAIVAAVPEPQKPLAAMLPLSDIPAGFVLAKLPGKTPATYIETFNADNLFEKIDGRAESFIQYGVKGMACCSYHPKGDEDAEVQLFVFEMGDPLKARGKYDSERPEEAKDLPGLGSGAYTAGGSTFFYSDRFYTIVNVARDDPKLATFAQEMARKVVGMQKGSKGSGPSPEDIFGLLPAEPKKSGSKYVAKDVFGYSFLSDVFLADYQAGEVQFQGFLRPYATADEAKKVFDQYVETARKDGATLTELADHKADKMIVSSNIGLFSAVFLKGNVVGGADGASDAKPAESFARAFAAALPDKVPFVAAEPETNRQDAQGAKEDEARGKD